MPFAAKSAAPCDVHSAPRHPALEQAAEGSITLFTAPPGYLLAGSIGAALAERGRPTLWVRFGQEDGDPATCLVSLIAGAQRLCPGVGRATLEQMRRQPGPTARWSPLFAHLAQELAEALPRHSAVVLEHSHNLNGAHSTLRLLGTQLLPTLPASVACILTAFHSLPQVALPPKAVQRGAGDLRLDARAALTLAERTGAGLPTTYVQRAVALTEGRAAALAGLFAADAALGSALVRQAVDRATGADDLLARVARAWLETADAGTLQALALTLRLEYSHPTLIQAVLNGEEALSGPWLQPLEDDWAYLRTIWRAPLRAALRVGVVSGHNALRRAADHLAGQGAIERAVPLYFELKDHAGAAQAIAGAADTLMNLGQWETLSGWLGQLPVPILHKWPWLIYASGEIDAAQDNPTAARRAFATAAALFTARHDVDGACQSLLAESALAAWHGDHAHAQLRALAASTMAESARLVWHQGWASWQLGCLAIAEGKFDDALSYFGRAIAVADAIGDPHMIDLFRRVEALTLHQRELHRQREFHRQAYFATERAEQETAERLRQLLFAPPDSLDALLGAHGWSRTPLMLKLPTPSAPAALPSLSERSNVWCVLLDAVGLRRRSKTPAFVSAPAADVPPGPMIASAGAMSLPAALLHAPAIAMGDPLLANAPQPALITTVGSPRYAGGPPPAPDAVPAPAQPIEMEALGPSRPAESPARPILTVHMLGQFRVALNDCPIENWSSGRGRAVFKYLLTHRDQPMPRDVLMDAFWPDSSPEAARNSLNVAMHGLRQTLRAVADIPVIEFQDGAYRLSSSLRLWLDVDEFERHVQAGHQLEAAGQIGGSVAEYELATGLYQGHFFADDPYEEWPVLRRERLRVDYLDTLDRLGQIYFGQGQHAACAALCQLILTHDSCREDAHCRLMRCYSRQGQHHLALRQYQACVEALRAELDVTPDPATTQLYERIRRREQV